MEFGGGWVIDLDIEDFFGSVDWGHLRSFLDLRVRHLASLIDEEVAPFTELVDWWQKDDLQRQMRGKIKRQLRASGVEADAVESLAANIVDLAKVRTDR